MEFRDDELVVCIKRESWRDSFGDGPKSGPSYGDICTIFQCIKFGKEIDLILVEHRYDAWHNQLYFASKYFRPLAKHETDISVFTKMLDSARVNKKKERT